MERATTTPSSPGPHGPPSPASHPGPATTTPDRSSLSPEATPFYPSGGRGKQLRWKDATPSDGEASPLSYRDAVLRSPTPCRATGPSRTVTGGAPPAGSVYQRLGPRAGLPSRRQEGDGRSGRRHGGRRGQTRLLRGLPCGSRTGPVHAPAPSSSGAKPVRSRWSTRTAGPRRAAPVPVADVASGWVSVGLRLSRHGRGYRRRLQTPALPTELGLAELRRGWTSLCPVPSLLPPTPRGAAARGRTPSPAASHPSAAQQGNHRVGEPSREGRRDRVAGHPREPRPRSLSGAARRPRSCELRGRSGSRATRRLRSPSRRTRRDHSRDGARRVALRRSPGRGDRRGRSRPARALSPVDRRRIRHTEHATSRGRPTNRAHRQDHVREHHGSHSCSGANHDGAGDPSPQEASPEAPSPMEVDASPDSQVPDAPPLLSDEDLPAGHPMLRPCHEVCIIPRCVEMDVEEARLRLALLAMASDGSGLDVPADAMRSAILEVPGVDGRDMVVRAFYPERFLIVFSTLADRDAALRAGWIVVGHSMFLLRPWTRLVRAEADALRIRVSIEIEGIPAHAASLRTAQKILSSSCWIERLAPASEDKTDQSALRLTAWTDNPSRIPRTVTLLIAEHERRVTQDDPALQVVFGNLPPYLRNKDVRSYPILIHLRSTADFRSRTPSTASPSPSSSDGDSATTSSLGRQSANSRPGVGSGDAPSTAFPAQVPAQVPPARSSPPPPLEDAPLPVMPPAGRTPPMPAATPTGESLLRSDTDAGGPHPIPTVPVCLLPAAASAAPPFPLLESESECAFHIPVTTEEPATASLGNPSPSSPHVVSPVRLAAAPTPCARRVATSDPLPTTGVSLNSKLTPCQVLATVLSPPSIRVYQRWVHSEVHPRPRHRHLLVPAPLNFDPALPVVAPQSVPEPAVGAANARPASDLESREPAAHASSAGAPPLELSSVGHLEPASPPTVGGPSPGRPGHSMMGYSTPTPTRPTPSTSRAQASRHTPIDNQDQSLAGVTAATTDFISSMRRALQAPLAQKTSARHSSTPASLLKAQRRSSRIANQNSAVRPSKRGEAVLMRKLGVLPDGHQVTDEARNKYCKLFDKPLSNKHLAAIRDLFPAAQALSDEVLSAAAMQIDADLVIV
ncbi:hypothetical protein PVAP13_5NG059740 [Panicum virgatum]|uniref:DUF4283 domain-containing protein n=1 Tax=Panicum virgatum TaxID=38727 RepID=A0A8T0S0A5_PANVG|nr:hypothetical protein PVAP13_5NG059740 [Panicum virgatum]